jgi:hypothetical protein
MNEYHSPLKKMQNIGDQSESYKKPIVIGGLA